MLGDVKLTENTQDNYLNVYLMSTFHVYMAKLLIRRISSRIPPKTAEAASIPSLAD